MTQTISTIEVFFFIIFIILSLSLLIANCYQINSSSPSSEYS